MKNNLLSLLLLSSSLLTAQVVADFENFDVEQGQFLPEASEGAFTTGNISLSNVYNAEQNFWSGWAVSATTDTETPGFMNQYSSRSGAGNNGSSTYGLTYAFFQQPIDLIGDAAGAPVMGMYVNNGTYAYFSMLEGDNVAKKFGGETGDDPDFFLLTVFGELDGEMTTDSVNFYLADYRFDNNDEDYIVENWTFVNLESLGNVDRLWIKLSSSDVGEFGMNTPAYLFVDDVTTAGDPTSVQDQRRDFGLTVYPNPFSNQVQLTWNETERGQVRLVSVDGSLLGEYVLTQGQNQLSLSDLPNGTYFLQVLTENGWDVRRIVKQ